MFVRPGQNRFVEGIGLGEANRYDSLDTRKHLGDPQTALFERYLLATVVHFFVDQKIPVGY
jgi:hypothetical protein